MVNSSRNLELQGEGVDRKKAVGLGLLALIRVGGELKIHALNRMGPKSVGFLFDTMRF